MDDDYDDGHPEPGPDGVLDMSSGGWATLDPRIWSWANRITAWNLSWNELTKIPRRVAGLKLLRELDLSHNALTVVSPAVNLCTRLRTVDISHNRLRALPVGLDNLRILESFDCSHNLLELLPTELTRIRSLRTLNASHNHLVDLPADLAEADWIEEIDVRGNDDLDVIPEACRDNAVMVRFLSRQRRQHREDISRMEAAAVELEGLVRSYDLEKVALREEVTRLRAEVVRLRDVNDRTVINFDRLCPTGCVIM